MDFSNHSIIYRNLADKIEKKRKENSRGCENSLSFRQGYIYFKKLFSYYAYILQ